MQTRYSGINLLYPTFALIIAKVKVRAFIDAEINVGVFETWRSYARQDMLFAQGKTKAKGGFSLHNYGLAADLVAGGPGKWSWDDSAIDWDKLGEIGESFGLVWGGRWSIADKCHFELSNLKVSDCHRIAFKYGELAVWAELSSLLD